jgi:hypothetical protein
MIVLRAEDIGLEGAVEKDYEVQYRVSATFEMLHDQDVLYRELEFPVAELANELFRWLSHDAASGRDFEFASVFSDERCLVRIASTPDGRWTFGSPSQGTRSTEDVDHAAMTAAVEAFVEQVDSWCIEHVGVSIRRYFRS